jgi:5-methylcytosine-specific restriction endonuclease McrA
MKWFKCYHCKTEFPEDYFYRDKSKPSGRKPRCKVCELEYLNRENRREYEKKYRKEFPEKRQRILRKWYEENLVQYKKTQTAYRETDKFKVNNRNHSSMRRARIKNNGCESIDFLLIYKSHPFCFYCGVPLSLESAEFDHFIPIAKGGPHVADNIRVSCMTCNRRKGVKAY